MIRKLIATDNDGAVTFLRLVLGVVFFAHGAQKTLGWFGGYGFSGTMGFFTGMMHIPALFAVLAIAAEFLGGLGLIVGLLAITVFLMIRGAGAASVDRLLSSSAKSSIRAKLRPQAA